MWGNIYSRRRIRLSRIAVIAIIVSIAFIGLIVFSAVFAAAEGPDETPVPEEGAPSVTIAEYNNASGHGDSSVTVDRNGNLLTITE